MNTVEFLTALWPSQGIYVIATLHPDSREGGRPWFKHHHFETIEAAAAFVARERVKPDQQVFHALHTFHTLVERLSKSGRRWMDVERSHSNAAWTRVQAFDLDVGNSTAKQKKYATREDALRALAMFIMAAKLPVPSIVLSGTGVHVYWRFTADVASRDWQPFADKMKHLVAHHGLLTDRTTTADASRVLRPIHTWNRKDPANPLKVELRKMMPALDLAVYGAALDAALVGLPAVRATRLPGASAAAGGIMLVEGPSQPPAIKDLARACPTFCRMASEARTCGGAVWRATLELLRHTTGGEPACHKASEGHPEYDWQTTQDRLQRYAGMGPAGLGPPRCATLESLYPDDSPCPSCANFGSPDSSPIAFARREAKRTGTAEDGSTFQKAVIPVEGGEIATIADASFAALLAAGVPIYQRSGRLVRPVMDEVPASRGRTTIVARLAEIKVPALVDLLARVADFQRWNARSKEHVRVDPPRAVAEVMLSREGSLPVPAVVGCVTAPTMRADGSVLEAPGYDGASRLYHLPTPGLMLPAMPEAPTRADAEAALGLLDGLLAGFPFVASLDRAVALSALMTPVLRGGMTAAPLHLIRAHTAGTGKSFLVDLAATIATGRPCPASSVGAAPEELEKRLTALLLAGAPLMSLDNVNGEVGGDVLCQAVERPLVSLRPLGVSETREVECRAAVFCTGNNTMVRGDMVRRTVTCNLDARVERPELRHFGFNPLDRVLADRGPYVAAVLTVARFARTAAGGPACPPLGSFEDWTAAVRVPLVLLGAGDPAASMDAARAEDPELVAIRELFGHWEAAPGLALGEFYRTSEIEAASLQHGASAMADSEFRTFLLRQFGAAGTVNVVKLGLFMGRIHGRVVDGFRLEKRSDKKHGHLFALVRQGKT